MKAIYPITVLAVALFCCAPKTTTQTVECAAPIMEQMPPPREPEMVITEHRYRQDNTPTPPQTLTPDHPSTYDQVIPPKQKIVDEQKANNALRNIPENK